MALNISTPVTASYLHPLNPLGYRVVVSILAVYVYLGLGPTVTGRIAVWLQSPPVFVQLIGVVGSDLVRATVFSVAYGAMWLGWVLALSRWPRQQFSIRRIWIGGLIFTLLMLPLPLHFSDDVFGYAQHGRTLAHHGQNPYLHTLRDLGDPWVQHRVYWSGQASPYGPVLTLLHATANLLGGDNFWAVVALLKLLMAGCFLLTGWFVQKILERIAPAEAGRGLFFFLWNPLVLLELPGQAHNDAVMVALTMCGLWLIVRQRHAAGFVAVFFGFLAKVTSAILMPLHVALLMRRRAWRTMATAGIMSLAIAAGFYVMFFRDPASLDGLREVSTQAWLSPTWLGGELLRRNGWEVEAARRAIQLPLTLAFGVFLLWRMTRVACEKSLLRECGFVLLFFLLLCTNQQNTWYATLLIPIAAVVRHPVIRSVVIAISLWPVLMYFRPFLYQPPFWMNVCRMLMLYGAAGLGMWYGLRAARAQRVPAPAPAHSHAATQLPPEWAAAEAPFGAFGEDDVRIPPPHEIPPQSTPPAPRP